MSSSPFRSLSFVPIVWLLTTLATAGCTDLQSRERTDAEDLVSLDTETETSEPTDVTDGDSDMRGDVDMSGDVDLTDMQSVCDEVPNRCSLGGSSCDGTELVICAPDASGCLVETRADCDNGLTTACTDVSGYAECVAEDPCAGVEPCEIPGRACDGDDLVVCAPNASGCLAESRTHCTDLDAEAYCDSTNTAAEAICVVDGSTPCDDKTLCDGTEPGTSCTEHNEVQLCQFDAQGCLVETTVDCSLFGQVCGLTPSGLSACRTRCSSHPDCVGLSEGDATCDGNTLKLCTDMDSDGCLEMTPTDCGLRYYCDDPVGGGATCHLNGSGDSCADPYVLRGERNLISGKVFSTDFSNQHGLTHDSCSVLNWNQGPEAVLRADLEEGDLVGFQSTGGADIGVMAATCSNDQPCALTSHDDLVYQAPTDQSVYLLAMQPSADSYSFEITTPDCGNGETLYPEECDDVNDVAGDGCTGCLEDFGYHCEMGAQPYCSPVTHLGDFGAPAIINVPGVSLPASRVRKFTVTFTQDVVLHGTTSSGYFDLSIRNRSDEVVFEKDGYYLGSVDPVEFSAGDYELEVTSQLSNALISMTFETTAITCGDGATQLNEECDDGNTQSGDGCTDTCQIEPGFNCFPGLAVCSTLTGETCSEAIPLPGAGDYTFEPFGARDDPPQTCGFQSLYGGDLFYEISVPAGATLVLEGRERDAELNLLKDCMQLSCLPPDDTNPLTWRYNNSSDSPASVFLMANNRYYPNSQSNTGTISFEFSNCGNGLIDGAEVCDDGNTIAGDGCEAACLTLTPGYVCRTPGSPCYLEVCGDGLVDNAEECDDGNLTAGDGCSQCVLEGGYSCSGEPSYCFQNAATCQDPIELAPFSQSGALDTPVT